MRYILVITLLLATVITCEAQTPEEKAATDLQNLKKALIIRSVPGLFPGGLPNDKLAGGIDGNGAVTIPVPSSDASITEKIHYSIRSGAALLDAQFSLAKSFTSYAKNMSVVTPSEASKIQLEAVKINNTLKYISGSLALAGTVFSATQLLNSSGSIKPKSVVAMNVVSLLPAVISMLGGGKKSGNSSVDVNTAAINEAIKKAADFAVEKGRKLAVHAFLTIEIGKSASQINDFVSRARTIKTNIATNPNDTQILANGQQYVRLLSDIDIYYGSTARALKEAITNQSTLEIYDNTTKQNLASLSGDVEGAITSWSEVRFFYSDSEYTIAQGVAAVKK